MKETYDALNEWLATRPSAIRELAERFPPGTPVKAGSRQLWVFSYTESGMLGLVPVNPSEDYDAAMASEREFVCAEHFTPPQTAPAQ